MPSFNRKDAPSPAPRSQRIAFDRFEVDLRSGELRKAGHRIRLQAQPFQLLAMLLDHAGEVVTRDEICRKLWPEDTFVDFDHSLAAAINKIREALGDSADKPRFVETLPKRGYRFIAEVRRELPPTLALAPASERSGAASLPAEPPDVAGAAKIHIEFRPSEINVSPDASSHSAHRPARRLWSILSLALGITLVLALWTPRFHRKSLPLATTYTQITNFGDAAFSPAISPDGRMIAFIRGNASTFPSTGEIYSKVLPNGEPLQLTHDGWDKYGLSFSPDGSHIIYTQAGPTGWNSISISAYGGEPRLLLPNAAALTWLDDQHVLFSEIKSGLHMGIATATFNRTDLREIYFPEHERGMAHYSYLSPDHKWILVVEMGGTGDFQRCRLIPFDGSSAGSLVGPDGACFSAAWSPDGQWMYFSVFVSGGSHLFRQPFPSGRAEQITFGPTEQIGVAAMPDGRSLVTAVGINESAVWLHDSKGEHLISPEGNAWAPAFSHDGHLIYYLLHRGPSSHPQELWVTDLVSGKSTSLMEGFAIDQYRVSTDGKQVVFAVDSSTNKSRIWLAACDRSFPPRLLSTVEGRQPFFGPDNDVVFSASDGNKNYLFRMKLDGSGRTKVIDNPITDLQDMSPDRLWAVVMAPVNGTPTTAMLAVPVHGGSAIPLCPTTCNLAKWSPDGSRFYIEPLVSDFEKGSTAIFTVPAGKSLPALPRTGISSVQDYSALKPAQISDLSSFKRAGQYLSPGPTPDTFVYARFAVHQNLFQVPIE